jgi:hypothetical protein
MRRLRGMNKHQKAAHRRGECRVGREQVPELLEMAISRDPEFRLEAASLLCPCHLRTRYPEVREALFRLMADPEPRIRRQAWHTIEDGGKMSDPEDAARLRALLESERDPKVRAYAERIYRDAYGSPLAADLVALRAAALPAPRQRGKCDFCGATNVFVERDFDTSIPAPQGVRPAWICERCT